MSRNVKAVSTRTHDAVIQTANKYVEGMRTGSSTLTAEAFHNEAIMYGFNGAQLVKGSIENLYDFIDTHGAAQNLIAHCDVVAITPTTAVVRVDMENDHLGKAYIDYLTLIEIDGNWRVITKVFHQFAE